MNNLCRYLSFVMAMVSFAPLLAGFNFVGTTNTIKFADSSSRLYTTSKITGVTGRIFTASHPVEHIQGVGLELSDAKVEFPEGAYRYTGTLDFRDVPRLTMVGNEQVYVELGAQLNGMSVGGGK